MDEKYEDITIKCKDCGNEFVFTAGDRKSTRLNSSHRVASV